MANFSTNFLTLFLLQAKATLGSTAMATFFDSLLKKLSHPFYIHYCLFGA